MNTKLKFGFGTLLTLATFGIGIIIVSIIIYFQLKIPAPSVQPTPTFSLQATPAQTQRDEKFDQSLIIKSVSFTDSKGKARKFIVYRKFRDDARKEYVDTYLIDENLIISSAIKIPRLSDPADGKHPDSGFGISLFDNTATINLSSGPGKKFIAVSYRVGDGESFLIIDENGLVNENISKNACDLVKNNYYLADYTCFFEFDSWEDASKFYVKLLTVGSLSNEGPMFRILMDAGTGKIIGEAEKI